METERICKTSVERSVELELFLDDGHHGIGGEGARLDRVLGGWAQSELDGGCIRELLGIVCARALEFLCRPFGTRLIKPNPTRH